ncbi:O-antigen ligase family protein [Streptomyces sp. NRRL S-118]|uniref:O-antigen ligase family protein n=1 Tax=Streptomyces sp. NRRL S-118 TaxID=1463881 RepID=UPI00069366BC|nr:O-antigen ligase family protein [Streptomyces sp. NRRL S-118]
MRPPETVAEPAAERGRAADVVGAALLGACAESALVSAAGRDARPEGVLLAVLALAAGYACGRIARALLPVAAAAATALAILGLMTAARTGLPGLPGATATGGPLPGDAGAYAALAALAAGAACCAASAVRRPSLRPALRLVALGVAGTSLALGPVAGCLAGAAVLLCSLAVARARRRGPVLVGLALSAGLVVCASWAVAEDVLAPGTGASVEGPLTSYRVRLWRDARDVVHREPLLGAGPGRFGELSTAARESPRASGRPHSAPLQQAAEQGLVGVAVMAGTGAWLLYVLWRSLRPTPVVLSAAAALTALAALAAVGNVLSFTPVTTAAGLLAGLATARAAVTTDGAPGRRPAVGRPGGGAGAGGGGG